MNNTNWLEKAVQLSQENVGNGGGPFGAVVVKNGELIACGVNKVTRNNDPTCHAEVDAIRNACEVLGTFELDGCELYSSCEPCPMCFGAIHWARLDKVFFANTREDAAAIGFDDKYIYDVILGGDSVIPFSQVETPGALDAFIAWTQKENKIEY